MEFRRRTLIVWGLLITLSLLVAACGTAPTPAPAAPAEQEAAAQPAAEEPAAEEPAAEEAAAVEEPAEEAAPASGKLEVFSWWTSGGEAAALDALFKSFNDSNPDVEIVNATVAGGGGSAARAVLQTRLAGGDPPDTWQVHPGFELIGQYVEPEFVAPVTDLYKEEGWLDVVPQTLVDMQSVDNDVYLVTVGVHRGNGFWY
ncbi:MAG TPA: ABC transporter substrate-binding protein, partial [Anaerolineae bacterium]|nr:ABC transporter substrate-binding protein [Anaerolineae bacterium]